MFQASLFQSCLRSHQCKAHDSREPSHVMPLPRHPNNGHVPISHPSLLATNASLPSTCPNPMSPQTLSSSFRAQSESPKAAQPRNQNSPVFSNLSLSVQIFSAQLLLHLNNGPPTNKSEKNARGVVVGVWSETRSKRRGLWALKLAYSKWAVKKPATHPNC